MQGDVPSGHWQWDLPLGINVIDTFYLLNRTERASWDSLSLSHVAETLGLEKKMRPPPMRMDMSFPEELIDLLMYNARDASLGTRHLQRPSRVSHRPPVVEDRVQRLRRHHLVKDLASHLLHRERQAIAGEVDRRHCGLELISIEDTIGSVMEMVARTDRGAHLPSRLGGTSSEEGHPSSSQGRLPWPWFSRRLD